jgi:hypothetical protein|tara:strand:- start:188 stop:436 length:249 start_codon:yes stop_codon:yes gene_type:complete
MFGKSKEEKEADEKYRKGRLELTNEIRKINQESIDRYVAMDEKSLLVDLSIQLDRAMLDISAIKRELGIPELVEAGDYDSPE